MKLITQSTLLALGIALGTVAQAREEDNVAEFAVTLDNAYQFMGLDNNIVDKVFFEHDNTFRLTSSELKRFAVPGRTTRWRRLDTDVRNHVGATETKKQLARCLFPMRGSRKDHIDYQQQAELTKIAYRYATERFTVIGLDLYLIENIQLDVSTMDNAALCGVLAVDRANHKAVLLQGLAQD